MTNSPGLHASPGLRASPGWRPLALVVAVVVLAHALVLQGSPAQFGHFEGAADPDEAGGKTFATRRIEPPSKPAEPAAATIATPAPTAAPTPSPAVKSKPNRPVAQPVQASAAPESIAQTSTPGVIPGAPAAPMATPTAIFTPTAALEVPPENAAALAASASAASASLSPTGPPTSEVSAVTLPGSARLQYSVVGLAKSLNYQASAELLWKASGDRYEAVLKVSAFLVGSRSLSSVGQITATGLAPTRFSDKARQELAAHFEPTKGKIVFSANTPDAPWVEGAQDRVSVFLQLAGILAAKPQDYPAGASISLYTVGPREADTWTFMVEQTENLDLMGAPMATLKLTRKPRREFDQKVEVWLAPSLGYLPVRTRITQPSGDFVDQRLSEISKTP